MKCVNLIHNAVSLTCQFQGTAMTTHTLKYHPALYQIRYHHSVPVFNYLFDHAKCKKKKKTHQNWKNMEEVLVYSFEYNVLVVKRKVYCMFKKS